MYIDKTLKEYLRELSAKQSVPGGGSAAGLVGALGAALLEMVCNFTIGNKKYKDIEEATDNCLISIGKIREQFLSLVDEDAKVYSLICEAFKAKDEKIIDNALREGYNISFKMCELAKTGLRIASDLAEKSNINLITDVGCGAEFLKAGFNAGVFNAEINLKGIKDNVFVERERLIIYTIKKEIADLHKKTISKVSERIDLHAC